MIDRAMDVSRTAEVVKEAVKESVSSFFSDLFWSVFSGLASISYAMVLVGGAICVILYVAGWERGLRWLGVMIVIHILLKAIAGGVGV